MHRLTPYDSVVRRQSELWLEIAIARVRCSRSVRAQSRTLVGRRLASTFRMRAPFLSLAVISIAASVPVSCADDSPGPNTVHPTADAAVDGSGPFPKPTHDSGAGGRRGTGGPSG